MRKSRAGMSLVEAVVVVFISSLFTAAILSTASVQNATNFRAYNKMTALIVAKRLEPQLEKDVHTARFFGDQTGVTVSPIETDSSAYFPSGKNTSTITLPTDTDNATWPSGPLKLDKNTLIIQVPVFETDGSVLTVNGQWNVDTYVYKILADKNKPGKGQFVMQKAMFPGQHAAGYAPPIAQDKPLTLLTGIVGPINPNDPTDSTAGVPLPSVFSYFLNWPGSNMQEVDTFVSGTSPDAIKGVSVNIEIFSNDNSERSDYTPKTLAFKSEYFKRCNGRFQ